MDDDKRRHNYADPFMRLFTGHLIGHQTKKEDSHADIYNPPDNHTILFSVHIIIARSVCLLQSIYKGLQIFLRCIRPKPLAVKPVSASGIISKVPAASADPTAG